MDVEKDWPYLLQRDELNPPKLDRESFTFTTVNLCEQLIRDAVSITALVGEPGVTTLPTSNEAFIGFSAGPYGLVVAAESFGVFNFQGEMSAQVVQLGIQKWWEYWREYWRRKGTPNPMPSDFACDVTIPIANDGEECDHSPDDLQECVKKNATRPWWKFWG